MVKALPDYIVQAPSGEIEPPVKSKAPTLPFDKLSWEDFERLCYRLAVTQSDVEYCLPYGEPGQRQEGIDIYARLDDGKGYVVYQCKRVRSFGPSKILGAVQLFLSGNWKGKSSSLVLCVTESMIATKRADAIEEATELARREGVKFICWGPTELSRRIRSLPRLVDDFFGREWVKAFCGHEAVELVGSRRPLSLADLRRLKTELLTFYEALFRSVDPGLPLSAISSRPYDLPNRYVPGRVSEMRERSEVRTEEYGRNSGDGYQDHNSLESDRPVWSLQPAYLQATDSILVGDFLAGADQSLIIGEAGAGKSALLRFLALELAGGYTTLQRVSEKWGALVPLYIPFAAWTERVQSDPDCSLRAVIQSWLCRWNLPEEVIRLAQRALEDERALLLVDGLDEARTATSGQRALAQLQTFLGRNARPVVITSRAHGMRDLDLSGSGWRVARLCELSDAEQLSFIRSWHEFSVHSESSDTEQQPLEPTRFHRELVNAPQVHRLVSNPLLLSLLVGLKLAGRALPTNRTEAYEAFVSYLLEGHPRRRMKASGVGTPESRLPPFVDSLAIVCSFERLAWDTHWLNSENRTCRGQAASVIGAEFESSLGLSPPESRRIAHQIVEMGIREYGVLVSAGEGRVQFAHAAFHSHLAGRWLARNGSRSARIDSVKELAKNRAASEVVLSLLFAAARLGTNEGLVEAIDAIDTLDPIESFFQKELLAEIAFGPYSCPPALAEKIAHECIAIIEGDGWIPHRQRLLDSAMKGLMSTRLSGLVLRSLRSWVPDVGEWQRMRLIREMGQWKYEAELVKCLSRALRNDTSSVRIAAAKSLVALDRSDVLVNSLRSDEPLTRESALYVLLTEQDAVPVSELAIAEGSEASAGLRLISLYCRATTGAIEAHVAEFLSLAQQPPLRMPGWADDLLLRVGSLLWGFPSVRDSVLQALDAKSYERSNLPAELSVKLLANNGTFPGVANAFANWLREYTHYHLDWAIWRRLGEMFEGNSEVHEAAKRRLFDDTLAGRCKAWIIIGGEEGKEALLRALDSSLWGAPQLPASLLIEFWGQDDTEIATAIVKKACKGTQEAASLAHLLPQLMPREDCKRILIECLREAKPGLPCSNLVRAIEAVGALDEESVVEQMIRLGECDIGEYRGAPLEALLRSHPDDPRVSRLVCAEMARHRPSLGVVARGYGRENVERVKETLLRNAAPLPEVFRSQIVDFLDVYMSSTSHAYDLLRKLTEDANEAVSTAATVAVCRYLKGGDPADVEVEQRRLKEIALSYGMTYMARRRMAVAGLSALDRLSCLRGETERGEWYEEPTVWRVECPFPHECGNRFSRQILENWGSIQDALGTDSWNTHLVHVERLWRDFAPAALTSSNGGRKLAETMLSEVALSETPSGLLKFIAKTRPRSRRLMQRCLGILTASGSTRITTHQVAVAAQLIGSHFRGERSVLEVLRNEILTKGASGGLLAALASGWPMSDLAQQYFLQLRKGAYRLSEYNIWILRAAALHADELLERLIQYLRSRPQPWTSAGIAGPVVRRLRWDSDLEFLMQKRLEEEMTASEVTTFVRLLSTSTGAYGRLYEWCRRYLRRETKDVGYDLIAGRYRSTRRAVLDAVANEGY